MTNKPARLMSASYSRVCFSTRNYSSIWVINPIVWNLVHVNTYRYDLQQGEKDRSGFSAANGLNLRRH